MSLTPRIDRLENNKIINGNFDLVQRGTAFAAVANGAYTLDRWKYEKNGTMVHTISQDSDVPNVKSSSSLKLDCTTADTTIDAGNFTVMTYKIEGYDLIDLAGETITLSFYVKSAKTGVHCIAFKNGNQDRSYIVEYNVEVADTWEKKEITLDHDVSGTWNYTNGVGMNIQFSLAAGSTFYTTPNSWQNGNFLTTSNQVNVCDNIANDFRLSQVMLNRGPGAGEFSKAGKTFAEELALAQRYAERFDSGVTRFLPDSTNLSILYGSNTFMVTKRAIPTGPQAVSMFKINGGPAINSNVVSITKESIISIGLVSPATAGAHYRINQVYVVDAEL